MRNRSTPRSTSTGHTTSRKAAANTSVPSDTFGAAFFAANATAKWPMNISTSQQCPLQALLRRVLAEPDPEQGAVEVLAGDGLAARAAVQGYSRPRVGKPVERDQVAFLRRLDGVHDGGELVQAALERLLLGCGGVFADSLVERIGQLLRVHVAHQSHGNALGAGQRQHLARAGFLL